MDLALAPRANQPLPNALAALQAKNPQASVDCGSFGAVTLASLLTTPAYTIVEGPLMSQWKFCGPVGSDLHLQVSFELRLFKDGEIEIFPPRLENCWFDEPGSTNKLITLVTVTIDGRTTFSEPIDVKNHTRPLCHRGNDWSYWIGTNAKHTPHHDSNYLHNCECMTPHKVEDPDPSALNVPQIYTPNYIGEDGPGHAGSRQPHLTRRIDWPLERVLSDHAGADTEAPRLSLHDDVSRECEQLEQSLAR